MPDRSAPKSRSKRLALILAGVAVLSTVASVGIVAAIVAPIITEAQRSIAPSTPVGGDAGGIESTGARQRTGAGESTDAGESTGGGTPIGILWDMQIVAALANYSSFGTTTNGSFALTSSLTPGESTITATLGDGYAPESAPAAVTMPVAGVSGGATLAPGSWLFGEQYCFTVDDHGTQMVFTERGAGENNAPCAPGKPGEAGTPAS